MRFCKYVCPYGNLSPLTNKRECWYKLALIKGFEPCMYCGKTYEETRTVFAKLNDLYQGVIPWEYRPKQLWYNFKCWGWKRYTTVKPRWLDHGYCDKTELIPYLMFECLCQYIELEKPFEVCGWEGKESFRDEILRLYDWWNEVYIPGKNGKFISLEADEKRDKDLISNMKSLCELTPHLWT